MRSLLKRAAAAFRPPLEEGNCYRDPRAEGERCAEVMKKNRRLETPRVVNIDVTNKCNALCGKCTVRLSAKPKLYMSDATFGRIVDGIKDMGAPVQAMRFEGSGESILHPKIEEFIHIARTEGLAKQISLGSNMMGMSPKKLSGLLDAGLTMLKMSVDTLDPDEWNRDYGVNGGAAALANLDKALDLIAERGGCAVDIKVTSPDPFAPESKALMHRIKEKYLHRITSLRVTDFHNWNGELHDGQYVRKYGCLQPFNQVTILCDGQISFCCSDVMRGRFDMGNINEISLRDYWLGDPLQDIRDVFIKGEYEKIEECNMCDQDTKGLVHYRFAGGLKV